MKPAAFSCFVSCDVVITPVIIITIKEATAHIPQQLITNNKQPLIKDRLVKNGIQNLNQCLQVLVLDEVLRLVCFYIYLSKTCISEACLDQKLIFYRNVVLNAHQFTISSSKILLNTNLINDPTKSTAVSCFIGIRFEGLYMDKT